VVNEPQVVWKFCETKHGKKGGTCDEVFNTKYTYMETCYCNDRDDCNKDKIDDKGAIVEEDY